MGVSGTDAGGRGSARTESRSRTAASSRAARRSTARTRRSREAVDVAGHAVPALLLVGLGAERRRAARSTSEIDAVDAARRPDRRRARGRRRGSADHPALRRSRGLPGRLRPPADRRRTSSRTSNGTASTGSASRSSGPSNAQLTLNYYYQAIYYADTSEFEASFAQLAGASSGERRRRSRWRRLRRPSPRSQRTVRRPRDLVRRCCASRATRRPAPLGSVGRTRGRARRLGPRRAPRLRRGGRRGPARRRHDPRGRRGRARPPAHRRRARAPRARAATRSGPACSACCPTDRSCTGVRPSIHRTPPGGADDAVRGQRLERLERGVRRRPGARAQHLLHARRSPSARTAGSCSRCTTSLDAASGDRICEVTPDGTARADRRGRRPLPARPATTAAATAVRRRTRRSSGPTI